MMNEHTYEEMYRQSEEQEARDTDTMFELARYRAPADGFWTILDTNGDRLIFVAASNNTTPPASREEGNS